jgi:hypothetical protein
VVGEGRGEEGGGVRGSEAPRRSTRGDQATVSVFILIRRAAALAAMRPTLLFKLE